MNTAVTTHSGRVVSGPADINNYWTERKGHDLYRLTVGMARAMFPQARTAIDVGCYTSGLIVEMDWIPTRVASDIQEKLKDNWSGVDGVEFVANDAFALAADGLFDLVISNQTIEHLEEPKQFVDKLLSIGRGLIISTTYETPAGMIDGHIQDPISLEKFKSWFPVPIDAYTICSHPSRKIHHIIAVISSSHPNRGEMEKPADVPAAAGAGAQASAPVPTKSDALQRLKAGIPISAVVDVGVRECTWELLKHLPDMTHYLFEPVPDFAEEIASNYSEIPHELHQIALSDENLDGYLISSCINNDGKVTHSQIRQEREQIDGLRVVGCESIAVRRFDAMPLAQSVPTDFLLKVDVDGKDLNVLRGFGSVLNKASAVIVECDHANAPARMRFLAENGFVLIDIVDLCYYGPSLHQFDAVFVRKDLITPDLRPPISTFVPQYWQPLQL